MGRLEKVLRTGECFSDIKAIQINTCRKQSGKFGFAAALCRIPVLLLSNGTIYYDRQCL